MDGVCEEKISRGRRFFLMGALALPVAAKIERVAKIIAPEPAFTLPTILGLTGDTWFMGCDVEQGDVIGLTGSQISDGAYEVHRVDANYRFTTKIERTR